VPNKNKRCWLLWPGFQLKNGHGLVFLQFNTRQTYRISQKGRTLKLTFPGCRVHMRNNRRRIVTRYFSTIVDSIWARKRRKRVEVVVRLKRSAQPLIRWHSGKNHPFLLITFSPTAGRKAGVRLSAKDKPPREGHNAAGGDPESRAAASQDERERKP